MPLVDVTYRSAVPAEALRRLAAELPHAVSLAVQCPEEPYDGDLKPGDVEVYFRARGEFDVGGLDVVVEVRSKWFESRAVDRQRRCDLLLSMLERALPHVSIGAYLTLPVAAWSQTA
jgi:hypothetical protein